jgi:hypothetical protein
MPVRQPRTIERLVAALNDAFTLADLEQLVFYALGETLPAVAGGDTLTERAFNLVQWAQRTGQLPTLVAAAVAARPKNEALRALVPALHAEGDERSGAYDNGADTVINDDRTNDRLDRIVSELGLMRGEVSEVRGRLVRVEAQLERREPTPLNITYLAIALVLALLIGLGTYWLGVMQ